MRELIIKKRYNILKDNEFCERNHEVSSRLTKGGNSGQIFEIELQDTGANCLVNTRKLRRRFWEDWYSEIIWMKESLIHFEKIFEWTTKVILEHEIIYLAEWGDVNWWYDECNEDIMYIPSDTTRVEWAASFKQTNPKLLKKRANCFYSFNWQPLTALR